MLHVETCSGFRVQDGGILQAVYWLTMIPLLKNTGDEACEEIVCNCYDIFVDGDRAKTMNVVHQKIPETEKFILVTQSLLKCRNY